MTSNQESGNSPNSSDELDKLSAALSILLYERMAQEPQHEAIGQISHDAARLQVSSSCLIDIKRIRREIGLCKEFLEETEDIHILNYHQGYLLELSHQLRDKVLKLVNSYISEGQYKIDEEVKVDKLIDKLNEQGRQGVSDAVSSWGYEEEINKKILGKRNDLHHNQNPLTLDGDYLDSSMAEIITSQSADLLSEEGLQEMKETQRESGDKYKEKVLSDAEEFIELNFSALEDACSALFNDIGFSEDELEDKFFNTYKSYQGMQEGLEIENESSIDNIPTGYSRIYSLALDVLSGLGGEITSVYVIGSTVRGDAIRGVSDINFVIVTEEALDVEKLEEIKSLNSKLVSVSIFAKEDFFQNKKIRFLCQSEGVLVYGEDLVDVGDLLPPGLKLAAVLNNDVEDKLNEVESRAKGEDLPQQEVNLLVREVAKISIRVMFTEAMSNYAVYENDFNNIIDILLEEHPENQDVLEQKKLFIEGVTYTNQEGLLNMVKSAKRTLLPLVGEIKTKSEQSQDGNEE